MILKRGVTISLTNVAGISRLGEQGRISELHAAHERLPALQCHRACVRQPATIQQDQREGAA
jgi:hypothetical protein